MTLQSSGRGKALLVAASSAAFLSACVTAPTMDGPRIPPQGSTWTSTVTASGSFGKGNRQTTTTMGMGSWQGKNLQAFHGQPNSTFVDSGGCWVGMGAGGKPMFSWDPPICYRYPIKVGNAWNDQRRLTIHAAKRTVNLESQWKVEAYEEVSVPAGSFGAFRITYSDSNGTDRVDWFSPELGIFVKSSITRTTKHPSGPGTLESLLVSQTIRK